MVRYYSCFASNYFVKCNVFVSGNVEYIGLCMFTQLYNCFNHVDQNNSFQQCLLTKLNKFEVKQIVLCISLIFILFGGHLGRHLGSYVPSTWLARDKILNGKGVSTKTGNKTYDLPQSEVQVPSRLIIHVCSYA